MADIAKPTTFGREWNTRSYAGEVVDPIAFIALGDGTRVPTGAETELENEQYRGALAEYGVLSNGAVERIAASKIESMTMTDSIQATDKARAARNIRQFTIAPTLAEAMQRISEESSVSSLFD